MNATIRAAAVFFSVWPEDIIGRSRFPLVCTARHLSAVIMIDRDGHTLGQIGRILGGRDHSTIFGSVRKARHLIATDERISKFYQEQVILPRVRFTALPIATSFIEEPFARQVKPKNDLAADDTDAIKRHAGTVKLGRALALAMRERTIAEGGLPRTGI